MWSIFEKAKRNPEATLAALVALAAQMPHAQHVFYTFGHSGGVAGTANAWLYAFAVESATFFFVLRGWAWVSWGFALASVGVNVAYYSLAHNSEYGSGFMFDGALLPVTWSMWLLSIVLPVAVAAFSHATAGHGPDKEAVKASGRSVRVRLSGWVAALWSALPFGTSEPEAVPQAAVKVPQVQESNPVPVLAKVPQAAVKGPKVKESKPGPVQGSKTSGTDDKDQEILSALRSGPMSKSDIARSVGLTVGAIDRMKSGRRVGRMVKLSGLGLVRECPKGWELVKESKPGPVLVPAVPSVNGGPK